MPSTDDILIAIPRATLAAFAVFAFMLCLMLIEMAPLWLRRAFRGSLSIIVLAIPVTMIVFVVFMSRHTFPFLDLVIFGLAVLLLVVKVRFILWPMWTTPIAPAPEISISDVIINYMRLETLIDYGILACVLTVCFAVDEHKNGLLLLSMLLGGVAFVANTVMHRWLQRRGS
jgi:hypothetical protein